jgi:hypothetical protein
MPPLILSALARDPLNSEPAELGFARERVRKTLPG